MKNCFHGALCAVAVLLAPLAARAGFSLSETLEASNGGKTLRNGTVYTVSTNLTLTGNSGKSALKVADDSTAVIFIPAGLTLTLNGGDASGRTGAGAGVEVPANSTLVVTGGGSLVARGGDGANGGNGANGDSAQKDDDDFKAGKGGNGGAGGGGAAAGIGGKGGDGGTSGAGGASRGWEDADDKFDYDGNDGSAGGKGANGGTMGYVYFLGSVSVTASSGVKGNGGTKGSAGGRKTGKWGYEYICGGGGGGGGGAGGAGAANSIGGGGAGGGAGGGGGSGGYFWTTIWFGDRGHPLGAGGRKGSGADSNDGEGWTDNPHYAEATTNSDKNYGGKGGAGGSAGTNGGNGLCYATSTVSGAPSGASPASTHSAIEYTLTFSDDWRTNVTHAAKLGYAMPTSAPVLTRANYTFLGWFDRRDGLGTKYYGADGTRLVPTYGYAGDLTLHAGWQLDSGTQSTLTVTVDNVDTPIVGGVSTNGPANCFTYSGDTGILGLWTAGKTYAFSGSETNGEVQIAAYCGCTVEFNGVNIDCSSQTDRGPFAVVFLSAGEKVRLVVNDGSQLKASPGQHAITLITDNDLEITGDGLLKLVGGDVADIAPYYDLSVDAPVALDTRNPDLHFGTGILTNGVGKDAVFKSLQTGERVWRVKVDTGCAPGAAIAWSGLPEDYTPQHSVAGANGEVYLWLPDGTYLFSSLSSTGEHHWVARVAGAHHVAHAFTATGLLIDGTDSGYLSGPGWYFDEDHTVVLTNAGPFVISGATASGVGVEASVDCSVTLSNLVIDASESIDNAAFRVAPGVTATIMLSDTAVLQSGASRASLEVPVGAKAIIDGEGTLTASTGRHSSGGLSGGAGIGGAINESAGTIEIRGGTVNAKTTTSGSGIGGGTRAKGGTVVISGGTVTAEGRHSGIGGGYQGAGGTTTISGGMVKAKGGLGAGIGAGNQGEDGGTTTIYGGIVTAQGGSYGAGIGGANGPGGTVAIYGGTVIPVGGSGSPAIGHGGTASGGYPSTTITGGSVRVALDAAIPQPVNGSSTPLLPVTCSGFGFGARVTIREYSAIPINYGGNDIYADDGGNIYLWLPKGTHRFLLDDVPWIAYYSDGAMHAAPFNTLVTVDGVDLALGSGVGWEYDGLVATLHPTNAAPLVVSGTRDDGMVSFKAVEGGEVVVSNLVIDVSSRDYIPAFDITASGANGTVTLRLAGENAFVGGRSAAGVECSLAMKLAIDGEGSLVAQGGDGAAGIGGYRSGAAGTIAIRGGVVDARGGSGAAGIGGGRYGNGGTIRIFGGTIVAKGDGADAQDVGAGDVGRSGAIQVTGGSLHASTNSFAPFHKDANGARVWPVEVGGFAPHARITRIVRESEFSFPDYGVNCMFADADGKILIWLPNGDYDFFVTAVAEDGETPVETTNEYVAHVVDAAAVARLYSPVGLFVNGRDIGRLGGPGWYFNDAHDVHLTGGGAYTLSGKAIKTDRFGRIGFDADSSCSLILSNLVLNTTLKRNLDDDSDNFYGRVRSPVSLAVGGVYDITLVASNSITAGVGAGIAVREGTTANFLGDGFLSVTGGGYVSDGSAESSIADKHGAGAGIGGIFGETSGTIRIALGETGEIVSSTTSSSAGIGGAQQGNNGTVIIESGIVTASCGNNTGGGAGIGGGYGYLDYGNGGVVEIRGGVVTAIGSEDAAGIGGGECGEGGVVRISGGVVDARGGEDAAGIGGGNCPYSSYNSGYGRDPAASEHGNEGRAATVTVSGGVVTAVGGNGAAGIGSGCDGFAGGSFEMTGGTVFATGGGGGAGIGGGRRANGFDTSISGGEIVAKGGQGGAGIGSGERGSTVGSWVTGGSVTISGGIVRATGGDGGAGVGGGLDGDAGTLKVSGGTLHPTGGGTFALGHGRANYSSTTFAMTNEVIFSGGAIYTATNQIDVAATNKYGLAVFPVDFDIGLPTNKVSELEMDFQGYLSNGLPESFSEYGAKDLYTDENGVLRLWLPPTTPTVFTAKITMEDGSVHYFVFRIEEDGTVVQTDFLVVNGEFVTDRADASGTGWTYTKSTGTVTLTDDADVQGASTNGAFRILVPRGGASSLSLSRLTLIGSNAQFASAIVISNDCTLASSGSFTNSIVACGQYAAAIEVVSDVTLTLNGSGVLSATGGKNAAGIGSRGGFPPPGRIVVESGTVIAQGGASAAGIGGGVSSNLQQDGIVITGGFVIAQGGSSAAGIGSGYVGRVSGNRTIPEGAVKISGGTVFATKGSDASGVGDFIASGNTVSTSGEGSDKSFVITGGNVHGANLDAKPTPLDADGTPLRYILFTGLVPGAFPIFEEGLPDGYGMDDVVADETGSLCLWLPKTDGERTIIMDGECFKGGGSTNNVFSAGGGGAWPDKREDEGGESLWRVAVRGLPPNVGVTDIVGLESCSVTQAVIAANGTATLYLPSSASQYDFTISGRQFHALVADAPAVAWFVTGVTVDGIDLGTNEDQDGWSYDGAAGVLSLSEANRTYTLAGTNAVWDVAVSAEAKGVKVVGDRVCLVDAGGAGSSDPSAFAVASGANLAIASGTIRAGVASDRITVLGGSIDAVLSNAVNTAGKALHKLTVGGLEPGVGFSGPSGIASDSSSSSLSGYDFSGVFADDGGCIYLWLPDGDYEFAIGDVNYIASIAGADTVATFFRCTGVYINGVDAGRPSGFCWSNDCGKVILYNERWGDQEDKTDYVITGTNTGAAVCFSVEIEKQVYVTLDNLVMTNAAMTTSPITIKGSEIPLFRLAGTNILASAVDDLPAVCVSGSAAFSVHTNVMHGVLHAIGAGTAPAFGPAPGESPGEVVFVGGTIVAAGGPSAAHDIVAGNNASNLRIYGASVHLAGSGVATPRPSHNYSRQPPLYCVEIPDFAPGSLVDESVYGPWGIEDDDFHPGNGWIADEKGSVYIWLTNGVYTLTHDGTEYRAVVDGADMVAVVADDAITGIEILDISVSGGVVAIQVATEPRSWLATHPDRIRVRANESLPVSAGEIVDPSTVVVTTNGDGTVTIEVPVAPSDSQMFYKVVVE